MFAKKFTWLLLGFSAFGAVHAQTPIYSNPTPSTGNQAWTGMLGNDFQVNTNDLVVTQLGVFTGLFPGFAPSTTIIAQLFDVTDLYDLNPSTNSIVAVSSQLSFTNASPGAGSPYAFASIAHIALQAGRVYSIQSSGWSGLDFNFNTNIGGATQAFNTFGGGLTQQFGRFASGGALGVEGTSGNWTFGGGNVTVTAIPEPASYALAMVAVGLLLVGSKARRKV